MDFNQAVQQILNTDQLFQTENVEIRGTTYKAFNKVPPDLKELLEYGKKVRAVSYTHLTLPTSDLV